MRLPRLQLVIAFVLACTQPTLADSSVSVYRFSMTDRYWGNQYDLRASVTFYSDGLIQSVSISSFSKDRKEKLERSLYVTRDGDRITQTYAVKDRKLWDATYQLGSNAVQIGYQSDSQMIPGLLRIEREESGSQMKFDYSFGKLHYLFEMGPIENRITTVLKMGVTTFLIARSKVDLPSVVVREANQPRFEIGKISDGRYYVLYHDSDGPLLASYRIEGRLRKTEPLVAVLNFLIYNDLISGPAVFPFMGGMP